MVKAEESTASCPNTFSQSGDVLKELEDRAGRQCIVRLARVKEVYRLAFVLMPGFSFSPVFEFQRPKYWDYPGDTFNDYLLQLLDAFPDPTTRIYVSEDFYTIGKEKGFPKAFPEGHLCPRADDKVVAGVAICRGLGHMTLGKGDKDYLMFLKDGMRSLQRDKDQKAVESYTLQTRSAKEAYWGHGHGTSLAAVCPEVADDRKIEACISATKMSKSIFERFGFDFEELKVKCERPFPIFLGKLAKLSSAERLNMEDGMRTVTDPAEETTRQNGHTA
ncbi:hypothetical protein K469DRAFT_770201 [Zopfia rhizophila CBS 207.26]|uniref:N-acetyltransferase domain-containing protein n=1 Tax=Zopfia rhizophila CBS 207.26 TaxID=1314779 RepID=A0A6A6ED78_9PEZI|nr:hypothetical protein K469DRAFT_770201 [Zopfia rhizophila CBS 207.26]